MLFFVRFCKISGQNISFVDLSLTTFIKGSKEMLCISRRKQEGWEWQATHQTNHKACESSKDQTWLSSGHSTRTKQWPQPRRGGAPEVKTWNRRVLLPVLHLPLISCLCREARARLAQTSLWPETFWTK